MEEDFSKYNGEGTTLRKAQLRMLDILIEVDKICRRHNIQYWLDYGTLLGAVRHEGFIPWDDDIDISMLEADYHRFLEIAEKELSPQFVLQNSKTEKYYPLLFSKIVDKNSIVQCEEYSFNKKKYQGLWIDIFPMIRGNVKMRCLVDGLYGRCYRRIHHLEPFSINVILGYILYPVALLGKWSVQFLSLFYPANMFMRQFGTTDEKIQKNTDDYLPTTEIVFEGRKFMCPAKTDKVLRDRFGDYMQIPPEDKREVHAVEIEFLDE